MTPLQRTTLRNTCRAHPDYSGQTLAGEGDIIRVCALLGVDLDEAVNATFTRANRDFKNISNKGGNALDTVAAGRESGPDLSDDDWSKIKRIARLYAKEECERAFEPIIDTQIIVETAKGARNAVEGHAHPAFGDFLTCLMARDFDGARIPVYLSGPAGTGKTTAARQAAKALGLPFYFQSQATEAFELVGFIDGAGRYHSTPFVDAFREGGLILLDELDRWEPVALIALNSPLANARMTLPTGEVIEAPGDFACVGAGNTIGYGADAEYVTAKRLDGSTLSRFALRVHWGIDHDFEQMLTAAKYPDHPVTLSWASEVHIMRAVFKRMDLPAIADMRTIQAGAAMLVSGADLDAVRRMTYLAPLDEEQRESALSILSDIS